MKICYFSFGIPTVDLPACSCGGDFIDFDIDVCFDGQQIVLLGRTVCGECDFEPATIECGSDCDSWRDAFLRCANSWSAAQGGAVWSALGLLPDDLEEMVSSAEDQLGPLPEFRARTVARCLGQ